MFEDKIRDLLKKLGLDEGLVAKIKVEKEEEIGAAVLKAATESEVDRRINKAVDSRDKKIRELEVEIAETKKSQTSTTTTTTDDKKQADVVNQNTPDIAKIVQEAIKPFADKLAAVEKVTAEATRGKLIDKALQGAGLPVSMAKYVNVGDDADEKAVEEAVKGVKADFAALRQAEIDKTLEGGGVPPVGGSSQTVSEDSMKAFAASRNKTAQTGGLFTERLAEIENKEK